MLTSAHSVAGCFVADLLMADHRAAGHFVEDVFVFEVDHTAGTQSRPLRLL